MSNYLFRQQKSRKFRKISSSLTKFLPLPYTFIYRSIFISKYIFSFFAFLIDFITSVFYNDTQRVFVIFAHLKKRRFAMEAGSIPLPSDTATERCLPIASYGL